MRASHEAHRPDIGTTAKARAVVTHSAENPCPRVRGSTAAARGPARMAGTRQRGMLALDPRGLPLHPGRPQHKVHVKTSSYARARRSWREASTPIGLRTDRRCRELPILEAVPPRWGIAAPGGPCASLASRGSEFFRAAHPAPRPRPPHQPPVAASSDDLASLPLASAPRRRRSRSPSSVPCFWTHPTFRIHLSRPPPTLLPVWAPLRSRTEPGWVPRRPGLVVPLLMIEREMSRSGQRRGPRSRRVDGHRGTRAGGRG